MAVEEDGHPDNVPAMMGGIMAACVDGGEVLYVKIQPPESINGRDDTRYKNQDSKGERDNSTDDTSEDAVFNIGRTAMLVASLAGNRESFCSNSGSASSAI